MTRRGRDAWTISLVVLAVVAMAGGLSVAMTRSRLADSFVVASQFPYAVSGALGGVAVIGFAVAMIAVQAGRRSEADERAEFDRVITAAAALLTEVRR